MIKQGKRILVGLLSAAMILGAVPLPAMAATPSGGDAVPADVSGNQTTISAQGGSGISSGNILGAVKTPGVTGFTDAGDRGGWKKASGPDAAKLEFVDGEGDAGYMQIAADNEIIVYDDQAESLQDGYVEMDVTRIMNCSFAIAVRYENEKSWEAISVDKGTWGWCKGDGTWGSLTSSSKTSFTDDNEKHRIRIEYEGKQIRVLEDGVTIIDETINEFSDDKSGKVGMRVWGYVWPDGTDMRCTVKIDNVSAGSLGGPVVPGYDIGFSGEGDRGQWARTDGNGAVTFQDGEGEQGYAVFTADGNTIFADTSAPSVENGYIEMKITNLSVGQERFALAFRYGGPADWQGIGFDMGDIRAFDGGGWYTDPLAQYSFQQDTPAVVRVEYKGTKVDVLIDGKTVLTYNNAEKFQPKAGTAGLRVWGWGTGVTQGSIKVDYVKAGELEIPSEVVLTPSRLELDGDEALAGDVEITLSNTENPLVSIAADDTVLESGTDYKVQDDKVTILRDTVAKLLKGHPSESEIILDFTFKDSFKAVFTIYVLREEPAFTYERDFSKGIEGFEKVSGSGTVVQEGSGAVIKGEGIFIDQDSAAARNQEVEFTYNPLTDGVGYGIILRYVSPDEYLYIGPSSHKNQWYTRWSVYNQNGQVQEIDDCGFVMAGREDPYKIKARISDQVVTLFIDNEIVYSKEISSLTGKAGKIGFRTKADTQIKVYGMKQQNAVLLKASAGAVTEKTISSGSMDVVMDSAFPRVIRYELAGGAGAGGQEKPLYYVEVNNTVYIPEVTADFSRDIALYTLNIPQLGISFDVQYQVVGNALEMKILNVRDSVENPVYTINFPNQSMVSLRSSQPGAQLRVNNYEGENVYNLSELSAHQGYYETTLAVLSSDQAAASLSGESYKNRKEVAYQTVDYGTHTTTGLWLNEFTYRGVDKEIEIQVPWARAAVVADINGDGAVDYQDGAVALRDLCKDPKVGADTAVSNWSMIAMNVGSEAQYPFLRILDNAKKIYLATDGFGQNIIIKGYQSEGHDASHPDFANYNKRAGGLEDLKVLLKESENYNTKIGIHINHTDVYPESPQFGKIASGLGAWDWYDTAKGIIRENDDLDKSENGLDGRMKQLFDTDTENMLDTVYIDVFFGTRWPMYKLISNVNDRNMMVGTEYTNEMVSFSTFAHHIGTNYGGAGNLVRFVDNSQADIFTSHQLFRGTNDRANDQIGIDGWQTAKNLNNALTAFYTMVLPNKYLAQFPIMEYKDDTRAVLGENREVVTEMVNGVNVISKDGKKIAEGNTMFIPWDAEKETKIYHYNPNGGTTTWDLPDSWQNVTDVKLYELSDEGRGEAVTIAVNNHKVTLTDMKAGVGYVIYKGTETVPAEDASTMEWSTGSVLRDNGFDSHGFQYWKKADGADNIVIENNSLGNSHLYIKGTKAGSVSQVMTGLVPGESYSASVWAVTTDGRKASITVENGDEILENYMTRSNVQYGYHHNDKYLTYAQRMSVRFVAKSDTAVLTLAAEACGDSGSAVDFDDVRVMKCGITDPGSHTYFEDFENVDQGMGIFTSPNSDQSHLSQINPVDPQYTPDVVNGTYSLKVRAGDYLRTLPSTVRLEPNTTYTVGLSYKSPSANSFKMGVKSDKASEAGDTAAAVLVEETASLGGNITGTITAKFTTGDYDDYYIDITKYGATEYYIDDVFVDEAKPMNAETLKALIQEAKEMDKALYTPETYEKVEQAAKLAEELLKEEAPSKEQIAEKYKNLEAAMGAAERYAGTDEKNMLQQVTDGIKALLPGDYVQDAKWVMLQSIIEEAEALLGDNKATVSEVKAMIEKLENGKGELTPKVDRTRLNAILAKAQRVDRNSVVDGKEIQAFLTAMEEARAANAKPGVTEAEILAAAEKLESAYGAIVLKEDSKTKLITEAIKLTDVKEEYFRDEDLAAIRSAKAKLQELQKKKDVLAKEYFDALEVLEEALGNKQSLPVLSDSRKIDSSGFGLMCNNYYHGTGGEGPVELAFDNDPDTIWHSDYNPYQALPATIIVDMKADYVINQFSYLCRPSGDNGKITSYALYYQTEGQGADEWSDLVINGSFANDNTVEKVKFSPVTARKVKIVVKAGKGDFGSAAEFALYEKVADMNELQNAVAEFDSLDTALYTENSVNALKKLIDKARGMLRDQDTPQEEVDALVEEIIAAKGFLQLLPTETDIRALKNAVQRAKDAKEEDYKAGSEWDAFRLALADAEKELTLAEEGKTTQDSVQGILLALTEAQEALIPAEGPADPTDPSNPDNPTGPADPSNPDNPTGPADPSNPDNPSGPDGSDSPSYDDGQDQGTAPGSPDGTDQKSPKTYDESRYEIQLRTNWWIAGLAAVITAGCVAAVCIRRKSGWDDEE